MIWIYCLFMLEAVVIVTGNVTVLVIFTRTPLLRKRKYYLLVSLAVADLLVGLISLPMYVTLSFIYYSPTTYENKQLHSKVSIVYNVLDILFGTASVVGLAAVAIERVYAVYFPFKHRTLTKGTYIIGIAVVWVMASFIAILMIQFTGTIWLFKNSAPILISLFIIIVSYTLIWIKINCMTGVQDHAIQGRDNKLTVTLLIVTIISLIAWIPFQVVMIYGRRCNWCFVGKHNLARTTKFLQYGNSLVNPIIYALRMPHFKQALLKPLRCCNLRVTAQIPEGHGFNRPNIIPLNINISTHDVKDEIQVNNDNKAYINTDIDINTHDVRDEIQVNNDNKAYTKTDIDINTHDVKDEIQVNNDNKAYTNTDIDINTHVRDEIQVNNDNKAYTKTDVDINTHDVRDEIRQ